MSMSLATVAAAVTAAARVVPALVAVVICVADA